MDSPFPIVIQPLIGAYLDAIEPLQANFYGIYIYGSIALRAYEELASDSIDPVSGSYRGSGILQLVSRGEP